MIKLAIVGYGNLGKGVETAVCQNPDMELVAVFTRRNPETVKLMTPDVPVLPFETLDITNLTVSEVADRVQAWVKAKIGNDYAGIPPLHPARFLEKKSTSALPKYGAKNF